MVPIGWTVPVHSVVYGPGQNGAAVMVLGVELGSLSDIASFALAAFIYWRPRDVRAVEPGQSIVTRSLSLHVGTFPLSLAYVTERSHTTIRERGDDGGQVPA